MKEILNQVTTWMTIKEAAEHLRCSTATLHIYKRAGKIPYKKLGVKILFNRADLDKFVNQN